MGGAADFIPTIEAARAGGLGLPDREPEAEHRLCALMVRVDAIVREVWSEQKTMTPAAHRALSRAKLPEALTPGAMYHVAGDVLGQTGAFVLCRVDHYTDKQVALHDTWVPSEMSRMPALSRFEAALEATIMSDAPPEALRCMDLTPRVHGGGYRQVETVRDPDFHGFSFSDTITNAGTAVERVLRRGAPARADVRAHAWPLLWLRYPESSSVQDYVLFVDPSGALRIFTGVIRTND